MAEDRLILLTNRGDGVDEIPNDELNEEDDVAKSGNSQVSFTAIYQCWFQYSPPDWHLLDILIEIIAGSRNDSNAIHVPEQKMSPPSIMYTASCVAAIGGLLFGNI